MPHVDRHPRFYRPVCSVLRTPRFLDGSTLMERLSLICLNLAGGGNVYSFVCRIDGDRSE